MEKAWEGGRKKLTAWACLRKLLSRVPADSQGLEGQLGNPVRLSVLVSQLLKMGQGFMF